MVFISCSGEFGVFRSSCRSAHCATNWPGFCSSIVHCAMLCYIAVHPPDATVCFQHSAITYFAAGWHGTTKLVMY